MSHRTTTPPVDLPRLPPRRADTSKRDYGRVVVAGGASGMPGAPALAAMAALRSGAGLVELLVPATVEQVAAGFDPCVMTRGLPAGSDGTFSGSAAEEVSRRVEAASSLAIGPGIGRSEAVVSMVSRLWRQSTRPAVFDADALWSLARCDRPGLAAHADSRILTPHAGEMLRLLGREPAGNPDPDRDWLEREAAAWAAGVGAVIVLKGPRTLVVTPGEKPWHNATGNPGMATAGTGDVLTGVIAALLAQGLAAPDAARLAVWVHGRAGDAAAADLGEISMTAHDLLDRLHVGFRDACANAP